MSTEMMVIYPSHWLRAVWGRFGDPARRARLTGASRWAGKVAIERRNTGRAAVGPFGRIQVGHAMNGYLRSNARLYMIGWGPAETTGMKIEPSQTRAAIPTPLKPAPTSRPRCRDPRPSRVPALRSGRSGGIFVLSRDDRRQQAGPRSLSATAIKEEKSPCPRKPRRRARSTAC